MVKVRLQRVGARKAPKFRIVVADEAGKQSGKVIEIIGSYDPTKEKREVLVKKDRLDHWLANGAQQTDAAKNVIKYFFKITKS